jgi:hypothetical protein
MRARQRHINPKAAGANLVLDARYISGIADGAGISTWSDRSGNGYDATQSNSTRQPVYKINIQGGQPATLFNGVATGDGTRFSTTLAYQSGDFTVVTVWKPDSPGTLYYRRLLDKEYDVGFWMGRQTGSGNNYGSGCQQTTTPFGNFLSLDATQTHILSASRNGTSWTVTSESNATSTATVSSTALSANSMTIGSTAGGFEVWKGYIFGVLYFHNLALSSSVLRRVFHAYGYSFKIACA